ncbi:BrnT family toxin [Candidatus Daviesbacteria bacterium]|nr:BrnT family toxin [Candidatus Daviesbacteria bacterium]
MKYLDWDKGKNVLLKKVRGIAFEDIKVAVDSGRLLDTFNHPNQTRYPNQKIMVVEIDDYAYLVPFVRDEEKVFLKTIIPSRKATKKYLRRNNQ